MLKNYTSPPVKYLPLNKAGRDFVIGDVHGAFDLLWKAMKEVDFDPSKDRIIFVGDLVDRGLQSGRVLKFLRLPYVEGVLGNHEFGLLSLYQGEEPPSEEVLAIVARMFSMQWWLTTSTDDRTAILAEFRKLPVAMEIETLRGTVGVVHGDVPKGMSWQNFLSRLEAGDQKVLEIALEGRDRIKARDQSGVPGVGRVFVGHTVQDNGPQRFGNLFAIDTGAIFNQDRGVEHRGLTMANVTFQTMSLVPAQDVSSRKQAGVITIDGNEGSSGAEDEVRPFGHYC